MLEFDPIANIFPMIEGQAREDFRADIRDKGLQEKIMLRAGRVLDGRNRYAALIAAGEVAEDAPAEMLLKHDGRFVDFDVEHPGVDPFDWVMSLNVHRRHMEPSQWAAVAANAETLKHGGSRVPARPVPEAADDAPKQDAKLQLDRSRLSSVFNVSPRLIASAAKVKRDGAAELFTAIEQGRVKASVAEQLLTLPKAQQREAVSALDTRTLPTYAKQVKRADTEKRLAAATRALPNELYNVILADPPWRFEPYSRETGLDRAADNHYPTQDVGDIKALPVGTLAAPDCVLFLWATSPMLPEALAVMRFWGFDYKSHVVWRKAAGSRAGLVLGTGYWFRNGHELLLVGTRGAIPAPAMGTQLPSIIDAEPRRHSQKPDWAHEMIETYYPNLKKIELNARARRPGWDAWGNEADSPSEASGGAGAVLASTPASEAADSPEVSRLATYLTAVDAGAINHGRHTKDTAEPIVRAAYACDPIIPTRQLAKDLGHPTGTALTWASRLGLTRVERRNAGGAVHMARGG